MACVGLGIARDAGHGGYAAGPLACGASARDQSASSLFGTRHSEHPMGLPVGSDQK